APPWAGPRSGPYVRSRRGRNPLPRLADGGQDLPTRLDGLGVDEDDGEQARVGAAIDAAVDGPPLHHDIAGPQVHEGIVELHVELTRDHHDVVDRARAVSP